MRSVIRWYRPLSAYTSLKWSRVAAILIRHHNIAPCQRLLNHDWLLYLSRRSIGRVAEGSLPVTQNKIFKFKSVNGYDFSPYMPKISNRIAIIMRIQPRLRSSLTAIIYQFKVFYSGEEMQCCSKWKVREAVIKQKSMLCLISIKFSLFYLCIMINAPEGFTGNDTRNRIRLTPKLSNSEQNGHSVQYRLILNRGIGHAWKTVINMC